MSANILNPAWKYTRSEATDIRKTIARERKRLAEEAKQKAADDAVTAAKVTKLKNKGA